MKLRNLRVKVIEGADWPTVETAVNDFLHGVGEGTGAVERQFVQLFPSDLSARVMILYTE